jgi:hypothetical protein
MGTSSSMKFVVEKYLGQTWIIIIAMHSLFIRHQQLPTTNNRAYKPKNKIHFSKYLSRKSKDVFYLFIYLFIYFFGF